MKLFPLFAATLALFVFSVPAHAQQTQCTTAELDLMCPDGQVLQGIANDGTKNCVPAGGSPVWGGRYQIRVDMPDFGTSFPWTNLCRYPNPMTGGCTCPEGYSAIQDWEYASIADDHALGPYCDTNQTPGAECTVSGYVCILDGAEELFD